MTQRRAPMLALVAALILFVALQVGLARGQAPIQKPTCDEEVRQLRALVQLYARQRTDAEMAWAREMALRQTLQERLQAVEKQ